MRSLVILLVLLDTGFAFSQSTRPLFTSINSKQTGIDFINEIKEDSSRNVLAYEYFYNGGGVAAGDINNDGLTDIFFTANIKPNQLYLNVGNFQFKDITKTAKVAGRKNWKTGVTMADVNGDGWLDIYVCYSGKGNDKARKNELYINNKDLSFTESAKEYGLDDPGCSTQAVFFDYDRDGDLDVYVLNHNIKAFKNVQLHYLKEEYDPLAADRLYRNDDGHFKDVSKEAGISGNPVSFGLGVAVSDMNNDGWPDIYVSNDYTEQDYLYINNKNGSFSQRELYAFKHMSQFSMGCEVADLNNDGLVDILTLDMLPEDNRRQKLLQGQENYELYQYMAMNGFHYQFMRNMLQLNNGDGTFSEIGQLSGIANTDWSWAPLAADFDNDGNKDLFVTNGYMRDYTNKDFLKFWGEYLINQMVKKDSINYLDIIKMMPLSQISNYAFKNIGDLKYSNVSEEWGLKETGLSNGAAYADLDNDGDLDLIINNINQQASLYRNDANKNFHFLQVKLKGEGRNKFGLGAKIYCYSKGKLQFQEQMPTRGYQSSVSEIMHFGLGETLHLDSVKIIWLDESSESIYNVQTNRLISFEQVNAKKISVAKSPVRKLFSYQKPLIDFTHLQIDYNDFKRQPLMPVMLSACGPKMGTADVNGDGQYDIFVGGSQGQSSALFLQQNGKFTISNQNSFLADSLSNTSDVIFFDADGDNDVDLYCVSGGYNDFENGTDALQDRLFMNDGKGNFTLILNSLPQSKTSKSCIAAADYDSDGDVDLFIGGRVVPGMYPEPPQSFLLQNDGKGHFTNVIKSVVPQLEFSAMITCAKWLDINKDGVTDLIVAGEWTSPMIFINNGKQLLPDKGLFASDANNNQSAAYSGWWNTIEHGDFDKDGDIDLIMGNWGLNSQLQCSVDEPMEMIYKDFDNNGSIDPFLCCYIQGKSYPYISRDELLDQIYPLRKKFTSYKSYADAGLKEIFSDEELRDAKKLTANHLQTTYFENKDGRFIVHELPIEAQFAPIYKILTEDLNKDSYPDLILLGNNDYPRLKIGKVDANFGIVLLNDSKGNFNYLERQSTGLFINGDVKDAFITRINGFSYLFVGINNSELINFKLN